MPNWAAVIAIAVLCIGAVVLDQRYRLLRLDTPLATFLAFFICWGTLLVVILTVSWIGFTFDVLRTLPRILAVGVVVGLVIGVVGRLGLWWYEWRWK